MISPAQILASFLIDAVLFTTPSAGSTWPLFVSSMPDGEMIEQDCAAIYDTAGLKDGRLMSGTNILHYGLQIRIRAASYNDGWAKAESVLSAMEAIANEEITIDAVDYVINNVTQTSTITALGAEPGTKRRELLTVNFLATLKEV